MSNKREDNLGIKGRALISLLTSWLFLVLAVTGLVLYVVPQGRIAYWVDWRLFGLTKSDWGNVHVVASLMFIVVGGWHFYYNWRAFLGHLRKKISQGIQLKKELYITAILTICLVAGALWRIPPVGYLVDLNEAIKDSWIQSPEYEPPFGHAELLSLKSLCAKTGIDLAAAKLELERGGVEVSSENLTLAEIARSNNLSPKDVFKMIGALSPGGFRAAKTSRADKGLSADQVFERFSGSGIGRMTLFEVCEQNGVQIDVCLARLKQNGINAQRGETVKQVGRSAGIKPIQVMQMMLAKKRSSSF